MTSYLYEAVQVFITGSGSYLKGLSNDSDSLTPLDQSEIVCHLKQGCKMDCENCDNCEIANCDCEEIAISQITQFDFEKASQFRK